MGSWILILPGFPVFKLDGTFVSWFPDIGCDSWDIKGLLVPLPPIFISVEIPLLSDFSWFVSASVSMILPCISILLFRVWCLLPCIFWWSFRWGTSQFPIFPLRIRPVFPNVVDLGSLPLTDYLLQRALNPEAGSVRIIAGGPSRGRSWIQRRIRASRRVWWRSSSSINVEVYEVTHSLKTRISCRLGFRTSAAKDTLTASGGSHDDCSMRACGVWLRQSSRYSS